jgi:type IV pilus assembly protein PilM
MSGSDYVPEDVLPGHEPTPHPAQDVDADTAHPAASSDPEHPQSPGDPGTIPSVPSSVEPDPATHVERDPAAHAAPEPTQYVGPPSVEPEPVPHVEGHPAPAAVQSDAGAGAEPEAEASSEAVEPFSTPSPPSTGEWKRRLALLRERQRKQTPEKREKESKDKRAKKLVGLKIGASQIAAARVVNNGAPEVVEAVREPLEPGIVVAGEIRDVEALGAALQRFFERHKLPKKGVRLGVANNRTGVRVFEIDGVTDQQQLENAIRFRAEEVLPIPLDQAVLDYVVLDEGDRPDGTPFRRILVVVAYREVVERYIEACGEAGLEVVGIDLEAFALLRSLAAPTERDQSMGALVAVAVGHDRTTIAVSTGRYCEFTRVLDWGGWSLNVAIARELDRAPSEVEAIKRQLSFSEATEIDGLTADAVAKVRDGAQRALAAFARELVASLHFYQAQPGALGIGEIAVTGGTAHMAGLPDALGRLLGVRVRLGDPFVRVKSTVDAAGEVGSLAVAIGLGIED